MNKSPDIMLLYRISQYYYREKKSQNEIAMIENISRSQISRLLSKAVDMGIVRFEVSLPHEMGKADLEAVLKSALRLREVVVVPISDSLSEQEESAAAIEAIATAATSYLPKVLKGCKTVGIGWGKTMYTTSLMLSYNNVGDDLTYVPLIGLSGTTEPYLQINTIVDRIAEKHRATGYFTGAPAFREIGAPLTDIENKRMDILRQYWSSLDAAVIGLGSPPSGDNSLPEISPEHLTMLEGMGASGDILAQYFTDNGSVYGFGDYYNQLAFNIMNLRSIPDVICLAGGRKKAKGILAASKLRYFNRLITDSETAKHIMLLLNLSKTGAGGS